MGHIKKTILAEKQVRALKSSLESVENGKGGAEQPSVNLYTQNFSKGSTSDLAKIAPTSKNSRNIGNSFEGLSLLEIGGASLIARKVKT